MAHGRLRQRLCLSVDLPRFTSDKKTQQTSPYKPLYYLTPLTLLTLMSRPLLFTFLHLSPTNSLTCGATVSLSLFFASVSGPRLRHDLHPADTDASSLPPPRF